MENPKNQEAKLSDDSKSFEEIISAVYSPDCYVRRASTVALLESGDIRAYDYLVHLIEDEDDDVRASAVFTLGQLGDVRAVPFLILALKDKYWLVKSFSCDALAQLRAVEAINPIIELFEDYDSDAIKTTTGLPVIMAAAEALGTLGATQAIELLAKLLGHPSHQLNESLVLALSKLGVASRKTLESLIKSAGPEAGFWAAVSIGYTGDFNPLLQVLHHPNPIYRANACWALRCLPRLRNTSLASAVVQALTDEETNVRWQAALTLEEVGDERALDQLTRALQDEDEKVRLAANKAIKHILSRSQASH